MKNKRQEVILELIERYEVQKQEDLIRLLQERGISTELDGYVIKEEIKLNICHWFTVDDLVYLKRGGRVSPTVAFVGNALGIKPILHVDNEGHLINKAKVRGRKSSITALADKYTELAVEPESGLAYISNGDCEDDANALKKILEDRHNAKVEIIANVGPVIR